MHMMLMLCLSMHVIAGISSVTLPSPTSEYKCHHHMHASMTTTVPMVYKSTPDRATITFFASFFDQQDDEVYMKALNQRYNNYFFGLIPGFGSWLFHHRFGPKEKVSM